MRAVSAQYLNKFRSSVDNLFMSITLSLPRASQYSEHARYTALAPQRFKEFFRD
jgi:hypothetical protein